MFHVFNQWTSQMQIMVSRGSYEAIFSIVSYCACQTAAVVWKKLRTCCLRLRVRDNKRSAQAECLGRPRSARTWWTPPSPPPVSVFWPGSSCFWNRVFSLACTGWNYGEGGDFPWCQRSSRWAGVIRNKHKYSSWQPPSSPVVWGVSCP